LLLRSLRLVLVGALFDLLLVLVRSERVPTHPGKAHVVDRPRDDQQAGVWKKLIWGRLAVPDTREIAISTDAAENAFKEKVSDS